MELNKKIMDKAYEPYHKEALYCFNCDMVVSAVIAVVFTILATDVRMLLFFYGIIPLIFVVDCFVNFRLSILSIVERKKSLFITEEIWIEAIKIEDSASGRWGSVIPRLYPKKLYVDRYKLICKDKKGRKIKLRSSISAKKRCILSDKIYYETSIHRTITYGKLSHIVLMYSDKDDLARRLNRMF